MPHCANLCRVSVVVLLGFLLFPGLATPIRAQSRNLDEEVRSVISITSEAYKYLHENPELGKKEFKAQTYLKTRLQELGFTQFITSMLAPTAVVVVLDTKRPGPVIALRAEMDARPLDPDVVEPADHTPRSTVDGLMHNCGHDVHAAILLGTAAILIHNIDNLVGRIVFVFQPAEETPGGADDLVKEGILKELKVEKIFALHAAPGLPVGTIAVSPGVTLAGSNYFTLKLKGKGSHAAAPYEGDDIPLLATQFAQALSHFPARHLDIANRPVVITVSKIVASGGAANVIPAEAEISGTIRAFEDLETEYSVTPALSVVLHDMIKGLAIAHKIDYEWLLRSGAPPTLNNQRLFTEVVRPLGMVWPGTFDTSTYRGMFSEDFSFYTKFHSALYFSLGIAKDNLGRSGVHTTQFTVHPEAFGYGVRLMTLLAQIGTTGKVDWQ